MHKDFKRELRNGTALVTLAQVSPTILRVLVEAQQRNA